MILRHATEADCLTIEALTTVEDLLAMRPDYDPNRPESDIRRATMPYTLVVELDGALVGTVDFAQRHIGLWIAQAYRNRGLATRALDTFFRTWAERNVTWKAGCWTDNIACQTVLERFDFMLYRTRTEENGRLANWYIR